MLRATFIANHIERTHTIELPRPREEIFPLFSPLGEKQWVPAWDPTFHHPRSGDLVEGAVYLAEFTEGGYRDYIESWRTAINRFLEERV